MKDGFLDAQDQAAAATAAPPCDAAFLRALREGLRSTPKTLPCRFFYDRRGSELFDQICELPEYYLTRTELGLLRSHAGDFAGLIGPEADIVEFGAGSGMKVRLLLDALDRPAVYRPIDISGDHLLAAARAIARDYPRLSVQPVIADFTGLVRLPPPRSGMRRVGFFPGSTIGNMAPPEACRFLQYARRLLTGGGLLIGVDLVKEDAVLRRAYDDSQGVTAAFNKNILERANRELGADFDRTRFVHRAVFNRAESRIEMHLVSQGAQRVHVRGETFAFVDGETIHTENSYKYTAPGFQALAARAGFRPSVLWTDPAAQFSLHWLEA